MLYKVIVNGRETDSQWGYEDGAHMQAMVAALFPGRIATVVEVAEDGTERIIGTYGDGNYAPADASNEY